MDNVKMLQVVQNGSRWYFTEWYKDGSAKNVGTTTVFSRMADRVREASRRGIEVSLIGPIVHK